MDDRDEELSDTDSEISSIPDVFRSSDTLKLSNSSIVDEEIEVSTKYERQCSPSSFIPESPLIVADIILKKQAAWLIKHVGVRRDFAQIVKSLWFRYLLRALPDVNDGLIHIVAKGSPWLGILREADFCQLFNCPSHKFKTTVERARIEYQISGGNHEDLEEYRRTKAKSKQGPHRSPVKADFLSLSPTRLTMPRLLAVIALALHVSKEYTLVSDLLLWIRTMQFPYMHQHLSEKETVAFGWLLSKHDSIIPEYQQLESDMAAMGKVIFGNVSYDMSVPLLPVIQRFVEELNLPVGFITIAAQLAQKVSRLDYQVNLKVDSARRASNREASAMACIVYSMILLFGMNDQTEARIDEPTKILQKCFPDMQIFDYQKWVHYIDYRRVLLFHHTGLFPHSSVTAQIAFMETHKPQFIPNVRDTTAKTFAFEECVADLSDAITCSPNPESLLVVLEPCHRPFRAHSYELSKKYATLTWDFSGDIIEHFMDNREVIFGPLCTKLKVDKKMVLTALGQIAGAQKAARQKMFPLRAFNIKGCSHPPVLENVPSFSLQWLIRVCAEMIVHKPESLLGEILFMEMTLFKKNMYCRLSGRGSVKVKELINSD